MEANDVLSRVQEPFCLRKSLWALILDQDFKHPELAKKAHSFLKCGKFLKSGRRTPVKGCKLQFCSSVKFWTYLKSVRCSEKWENINSCAQSTAGQVGDHYIKAIQLIGGLLYPVIKPKRLSLANYLNFKSLKVCLCWKAKRQSVLERKTRWSLAILADSKRLWMQGFEALLFFLTLCLTFWIAKYNRLEFQT